jgi:transaldolase
MSATSPTGALVDLGVSIWLDDLTRDRIRTGGLHDLMRTRHVSGITTNPTIFAAALAGSGAYEEQIARLAARGAAPADAAFELTTDDVADAADILRPLHESSRGEDGWVSIEVGADVARDEAATLDEARRLAGRIDRPNVFVKIPATQQGLIAIADALAEGISINVTLIFSLARYREVVDAYLTGMERAAENGHDLARIRSVASFFVSRVDTEADRRLEAVGSGRSRALKGSLGIANCSLAHEVWQERFDAPRARRLLEHGAQPQRLLWASTGVKDPSMRDTRYVEELVAPGVINTMPEATLHAVEDHGRVRGDTLSGTSGAAREVLGAFDEIGVSYDEITEGLEQQGVEKFVESGRQLLATVETALARSVGAA